MLKQIKLQVSVLFLLLATIIASGNEASNMPSLTRGDYGVSFISWYGQNAFNISYGVTLYVDPVNIPDNQHKADVILITHPHSENFSLKDIEKVLGGYTQIYGPSDVISQIADAKLNLSKEQLHIVGPFEEIVTGSYTFRTVPAYTTNSMHPQENGWLGYIITIPTPMGDSRLYFAGDTGNIIEMEELNGHVDVAFLPISTDAVESVVEAVNAATIINAEISIPTRYLAQTEEEQVADQFVGMLSEVDGIDGIMMNQKQ